MLAFAQEEAEEEAVDENIISIGVLDISFDEEIELEGGALYYVGSTDDGTAELVASTHDLDGNKRLDVWLSYVDGKVVTEGHDTNGDGAPDTFVNLDAKGEVQSVTGEQTEFLTGEDANKFTARVPQASDGLNSDDLVGDLSDITTEKEDYSWVFFVIMLIAAGGLYFFWRRQQ